jgi:hypothetical protein
MKAVERVGVQFGHKEVFGTELSLEDVIEDMKGYNLWAVLFIASKLNLILAKGNSSSAEEQLKIFRSIFAPEVYDKAEKLIRTRENTGDKGQAILFTEHVLLSLVAIALSNCSQDTGVDTMDESNGLHSFGTWLLALSDVWASRVKVRKGMAHRKFYESLRRSCAEQFFVRPLQPQALLQQATRTLMIVDSSEGQSRKLDIRKLFLEATDLTLTEYSVMSYSLVLKWSPFVDEANVEDDFRLNRNYFQGLKISSDSADKFLELLLLNPTDFKSMNERVITDVLKGADYSNNFMVFMQRPLIEQPNKDFFCVSPVLLTLRATEGIYWIMHEYLKKIEREDLSKDLSELWGRGVENYVAARLTSGFGEVYSPKFIKDKNVEYTDGLILGKNALFVIETKKANWTYGAKLHATKENMRPCLEKILGTKSLKNGKSKKQGLAQIYDFIDKLEDGTCELDSYTVPGLYVPIVVTGEGVPTDPFNRKFYEEFAREVNSSVDPNKVLPFIILSLEEVEYLEVIAHDSCEYAEELLLDYSRSFKVKNNFGYASDVYSFKDFILGKGVTLRYSNEMRNYFDNVMELFNKEYLESK